MRDYKKIKAWQLADDLTVLVYEQTKTFPKEELYGLTSQLRRVAYFVPAIIVEGSARGTKKDYLHFLHIARGSLSETQYFVHLGLRLKYLSAADAGLLLRQITEVFACLNGLILAVTSEI